MNQRRERRKKVRRSIQPVFDNPPGDRRRQGYERRNRTSVLPMPVEMAGRGDMRRFEENG